MEHAIVEVVDEKSVALNTLEHAVWSLLKPNQTDGHDLNAVHMMTKLQIGICENKIPVFNAASDFVGWTTE